jgi:hypothetical protein
VPAIADQNSGIHAPRFLLIQVPAEVFIELGGEDANLVVGPNIDLAHTKVATVEIVSVADEGDSLLNVVKTDDALVEALAIKASALAVNIKAEDAIVALWSDASQVRVVATNYVHVFSFP